MPIYEYKCANGHVFDAFQKISDAPLDACQDCGAPAQRVLHPVAIHFKGSGFHNTDYGRKGSGANGGSGEAGKDSGDSKPSESKPAESKSSDSKASAAAD